MEKKNNNTAFDTLQKSSFKICFSTEESALAVPTKNNIYLGAIQGLSFLFYQQLPVNILRD